MKERKAMTKIDLITGILGSGKTTFIKKYAKYLIEKGERIAILENDFGAVNIDTVMLQELKCENCTIEMIMGGGDHDCHQRRFKTQLISLGMQNYDRVIVEPSGIFDMDEFFDILYESPLDRWYSTGNVIAVAESDLEEEMTEQMEYLFASQIADSGKIIVSKLTEEMSKDEIKQKITAHANRSLEKIGCDRRISEKDIIAKKWDELSESDYEKILSCGYRNSRYIKKYSADDINSGVHYFMNICFEESETEQIINEIMNDETCGKIYRIKGTLPCRNGKWQRINAAKEKIGMSTAEEGQPVLIVIGDSLDKSQIDSHIRKYNTDENYIFI